MATDYDNKIYVISSIQAIQDEENAKKYGKWDALKGAPNKNLMDGIKKYCEINNAELILLTMNGMDVTEREFHPYFIENFADNLYFPEDRNIKLNKNCIISDVIVPPQNMDPATSIDRLVQNDQTMIYAHSKQRFKSIAAGNARLPKLLITTGAATYPNYNENNRRGSMAAKEQVYGAVIAEIVDDAHFNVRHVRANKGGKFIDLGHVYDGDHKDKKKIGVEALVLGDIHWGDHDENTIRANNQMMEYFNPKRLFLHDILNGHSVNPHERKKGISQIIAYEEGRSSIEDELRAVNKEINRLARKMKGKEINIVYSNHDDFLNRYLEQGDFLKEPWNAKIANQLAGYMMDGKNPIEEGIKMMGGLPSNVNFLDLRDDYKVWGWQLASHGHKGISGSRGSIRSREVGFGKSITGHTHAPEIQRNTIIVGTSTRLDLPYTDGSMSRWLGANAVVYEGGSVQLLPIINGKWRMKKR